MEMEKWYKPIPKPAETNEDNQITLIQQTLTERPPVMQETCIVTSR
jgi:hypothetical protein